MTHPTQTTVLIVGAGPSGLAAAISLVKNGCKDIVIVDAEPDRSILTSRAMTLHAATMEALESLGCAELLIENGIKSTGGIVNDRKNVLFEPDLKSLSPYTKYPYILLIPQHITEKHLDETLQSLGVKVLRPYKATELQPSGDDGLTSVVFENGAKIKARVIIAADGARSQLRQQAGITFVDPDGETNDNNGLAQMVIADVVFDTASPVLPEVDVLNSISEDGLFLCIPLPKISPEEGKTPYRIAFNVPVSAGPPPHQPSTAFIQEYLNKQGPLALSSDPTVNPSTISIARTIWSTRFRTHSAIADGFFKRLSHNDTTQRGAAIFLIGDAAHIHSPAGGQGMNLGIRDAVNLGPVLVRGLEGDNIDETLSNYASQRRERALITIQLTKNILSFLSSVTQAGWVAQCKVMLIRLVGKIPYVKMMIAWRLSGLGNR